MFHHRQIVRDEQIGQLELILKVHQQVDDLRLDRHVQRRDRFVADDQLRPQRQRASDTDALALAAGEHVRERVHMLRPQPDAFEQTGDALLAFGTGAGLVDDQWLAHDIARRHAWVQRRVRILIDHLHLFPITEHLLLIEIGDILAMDSDLALGRLEQLQQCASHRRLAAAALADQAERLAAVDMERDAVHRIDMAGNA